jgi:hypothetical protein
MRRNKPERWVVYVFRRPDGSPFYVGSGRTGRAEEHFAGSKSKILAHAFRQIRASGAEPTLHIAGLHGDEAAARAHEAELIRQLSATHGLLNRHTGQAELERLADGYRRARALRAKWAAYWDEQERLGMKVDRRLRPPDEAGVRRAARDGTIPAPAAELLRVYARQGE